MDNTEIGEGEVDLQTIYDSLENFTPGLIGDPRKAQQTAVGAFTAGVFQKEDDTNFWEKVKTFQGYGWINTEDIYNEQGANNQADIIEALFTRFISAKKSFSDFIEDTTVKDIILKGVNNWKYHESVAQDIARKITQRQITLKNHITEVLWTVYNHEEIRNFLKQEKPEATEIDSAKDLGERLFGYSDGAINPSDNNGTSLEDYKKRFSDFLNQSYTNQETLNY